MSKCSKYIEQIYLHPKVTELISKIQPLELQDDIRQEMAMALLSIDCKKIIRLNKENNLIPYTLKMIWYMGTSSNTEFYKKFKKKDFYDAYELKSMYSENTIPDYKVNLAKNILINKIDKGPNDAHEAIIFNKYLEFNSSIKVANYFKIPKSHVYDVIKKTKAELKKAINNSL